MAGEKHNNAVSRFLHSPMLPGLSIGALCALLCFAMLALTLTPKQYSLHVGEVASETLNATREIEDRVTTQKQKDLAAASVPKENQRDAVVSMTVLSQFQGIMSALDDQRAQANNLLAPLRVQFEGSAFTEQAERVLGAAYIQSVRQDLPIQLDDVQIKSLLYCAPAEFQAVSAAADAAMRQVMQTGILQGQTEEGVARVMSDLSKQTSLAPALLPIVEAGVRTSIQPNVSFDEAAYEKKVQEAVGAVVPKVYKMGEVIVREGDVVTQAQIDVLLELGLLSEQLPTPLYIGLFAMTLLLSTVVLVYLLIFDCEIILSPRQMLLFSVIILVTLALSMALSRINAFFIPMQLGVLLIALLFKPRLALVTNTALAVLMGTACVGSAGLFSIAMFELTLTCVVGGSLAVFLVRRAVQRSGLVLAGVGIGFSNLACMLALGLLTTSKTTALFSSAAWAMCGGFLSAVLALGLMPLFEYIFGLLTPSKLLELSNPNQPLLRRLMLEAPGTYHHSVLVANLAEAAVEEVGGNELLARVGAYYHDVGKLKRPLYFGENQLGGDNPHDRMEPQVSAAILTVHPRDGMALAQKERLPGAILDIIQQHHGNSCTAYFYHKACQLQGEQNVDQQDYRYDGPRPQTREAAIIMLADTTEAAVRSMTDHAKDKMEAFVAKLIQGKLEDGQLDEAPLTLRDLRLIGKAFCSVLAGIYHERVEYPTIESLRPHRALPGHMTYRISGERVTGTQTEEGPVRE